MGRNVVNQKGKDAVGEELKKTRVIKKNSRKSSLKCREISTLPRAARGLRPVIYLINHAIVAKELLRTLPVKESRTQDQASKVMRAKMMETQTSMLEPVAKSPKRTNEAKRGRPKVTCLTMKEVSL